DAYVLKRIMESWNDDTSVGILKRCRDAVVDGGRVVVGDAVVAAGNEFHWSKPFDLLMMVLLDGRERAEAEFRELFGRAGLKLNRIERKQSFRSSKPNAHDAMTFLRNGDPREQE